MYKQQQKSYSGGTSSSGSRRGSSRGGSRGASRSGASRSGGSRGGSAYSSSGRGGRNNFRSHGGAGQRSFDPRSVIRSASEQKQQTPVVQEITNQFSDFPLDPRLQKNIADRNFAQPSPIQDQAIPQILAGKDVVGVANTGTGKTAAFLIPLINKVLVYKTSKTLIIAPTRELAVQIDKELQKFSRGLQIYSTICIGGVPIRAQISKLQKRPQFVIGTPGRLLDLANQRKISFEHYNNIVLDEVDRMLDMGFIHDINQIISTLPEKRQSLFFSATLADNVRSVMSRFITDPVMISIKTAETSANIKQDIIELKGRNKTDVLFEVLRRDEVNKTLIFMRTKHGADKLHKSLIDGGFQTAVMHGNKSQGQRQKSLEAFRNGKVSVLIATDVASRGIDVDDISHVINHDLPESRDAYTHRIGRTGRANKKGTALTFIG